VETLVVLSGLFREARFPLASRHSAVGRDAACDVRLSDPSVSHAHARIDRTDDGLVLVDLGSLNGTFVNGERLRGPRRLQDQDEIRFGDVRLRFLGPGPATSPDVPEAARRNRSRSDALAALQSQVGAVQDWETVAALLTRTLARLLGAGACVQCAISTRSGELVAHHGDDRTMLSLPPRAHIDAALAVGGAVRLGAGELLVAFRARADVPLRALHVAGEALTDADMELVEAAVRAVEQTPALRGPGAVGTPALGETAARVGIVGRSAALRRVVEEVTRAAPSSAPVLVLGESGTGKELVARAIHALGAQAEEPFVPVNCAALVPELIDSELFGHEKGAFTGAAGRHRGLFEQAAGGTLFLDEVGDLTPAAQAKLLRTLDTGEYRRVGGQDVLVAQARIVCATNRELERAVEAGSFRADLYYRVAGFVIRIPPLCERSEDVEPLLQHYLAVHAADAGLPAPALSAPALEKLRTYPWPGNVRELSMVVRRLVRAAPAGVVVDAADVALGPASAGAAAADDAAPELVSIREVERRHILAVLEACQGNKTRAAEVLGISRVTLYDKLRVYRLE
jgi:DNA-binding NtrC family response regulator